jgi:hypothetical protein
MLVQMIRMIAKVNCSITSNFRGVINAFAALNVPFKTFAGLKADMKNAG